MSRYSTEFPALLLAPGESLSRALPDEGPERVPTTRIGRHGKRAIDCVAAAILLVLLLPLMLILALLICRDGGPAFFGHQRIGQDGRLFRCLKFRTMATDADRMLAELLATDPAAAEEWRHTQKLRNDPRITRVGGFLRKSSLDEIPQLINVLRGEMSLVGPRPIVNDELVRYGEYVRYYFATRPGITGLWQVSGRSGTSYQERVRLDVHYASNWSIGQDMLILAKTIPAVLLRRGAH